MYKLILFYLLVLNSACTGSLDEKSDSFLDNYILSMTTDVKNYKLILELSEIRGEDQESYFLNMFEMKVYDLNGYLPIADNTKLIRSACKTARSLNNDSFSPYINQTDGLNHEVQKLLSFCKKQEKVPVKED